MPVKMTLGEIAKALNRPIVYLMGLQRRFELPVLDGAAYSGAYFALFRKIVQLRVLSVPEDVLVDLWKTEKHLLTLLHFDNPRSSTWFLDQCERNGNLDRRLMLTHHDMGLEFANRMLQPQLDFDPSASGLFSHREAGDDVLHVLGRYRKLAAAVVSTAEAEASTLRASLHALPHLRAAMAGA
jgi:hypothetical protein